MVWCYEQFNGYGASLKIEDSVRDLDYLGWDNIISSCKFTGFWLLYEDTDYNDYNPNVSITCYL